MSREEWKKLRGHSYSVEGLLNGIQNNYTNFRIFEVMYIIQYSYLFWNIFSQNNHELFFQEHLTIGKNQEPFFFFRTFQERSHPAKGNSP